MKKTIVNVLVMMLLTAAGCNGGETNQGVDTAGIPAATDTMPVLHPGRFDSSGTIKTGSTNDNNAIMPDSAINNQ